MEDHYDVFYCTVCQLCKSTRNLEGCKFCSGCKLVQYCCSAHQKIDWPKHKEFCKCVQLILKRTNSLSLFQDSFKLGNEDATGWNDHRMSVLRLAELILKRSLSIVESQMILFPPACNFCHLYKANHMFACTVCNSVMYCGHEHKARDKKHSEICELVALSFKVDLCRHFMKQDLHTIMSLKNEIKTSKDMPQSMQHLLKHADDSLLEPKTILLSEFLSYTMTLAHVIFKSNKCNTDNLIIHIVGADAMEVLACRTIDIVFHILPQLHSLKIIMIGPNLMEEVSISSKISKHCSVDTFKGVLYHDYVSSRGFIHPDIIAVFNCGFCEFQDDPSKDEWKQSLGHIVNIQNTIIFITSYTLKEAQADVKRLCELKSADKAITISQESKINLFSSLYPHRDWESPDDVFYINKYISILETYI